MTYILNILNILLNCLIVIVVIFLLLLLNCSTVCKALIKNLNMEWQLRGEREAREETNVHNQHDGDDDADANGNDATAAVAVVNLHHSRHSCGTLHCTAFQSIKLPLFSFLFSVVISLINLFSIDANVIIINRNETLNKCMQQQT